MNRQGIDISYAQKNYPYEKSVQEGVEFAIIRAGYLDYDQIVIDSQFENHYYHYRQLNIPMGVYWFCYARNRQEGIREAQCCLEVIRGKHFEYPVYYDVESAYIRKNSSYQSRTEAVEGFCETIEAAGYYVGVYTNKDFYLNVIDGRKLNQRFDWWIAYYQSYEPAFCLNFGMWQQGQRIIAGVNTDHDIARRDFPDLIRRNNLNHLQQLEDNHSELDQYTDEELALMVLQGIFGNGNDRKRALGHRYSGVQDIINTKYYKE